MIISIKKTYIRRYGYLSATNDSKNMWMSTNEVTTIYFFGIPVFKKETPIEKVL